MMRTQNFLSFFIFLTLLFNACAVGHKRAMRKIKEDFAREQLDATKKINGNRQQLFQVQLQGMQQRLAIRQEFDGQRVQTYQHLNQALVDPRIKLNQVALEQLERFWVIEPDFVRLEIAQNRETQATATSNASGLSWRQRGHSIELTYRGEVYSPAMLAAFLDMDVQEVYRMYGMMRRR